MENNSLKKIGRRDLLKISGPTTVGILAGYTHFEASNSTSDLVLKNGKVITTGPVGTITQSVTVKKGKILEVGKDEKISKYIGPGQR